MRICTGEDWWGGALVISVREESLWVGHCRGGLLGSGVGKSLGEGVLGKASGVLRWGEEVEGCIWGLWQRVVCYISITALRRGGEKGKEGEGKGGEGRGAWR